MVKKISLSHHKNFSQNNRKKIILLVDDDIMVRDTIKYCLEMQYDVLEASNCSEAISKLQEPILDLALIDLMLPDGSGFNVINEIRRVKPALPIIMMTAYSTEDTVIEALRKKVTDFIKKPSSIRFIMDKVSEVLGEEKPCEYAGSSPCEDIAKKDGFIMDSMALFIERNYMEDLTLEKMVKLAHMNRKKFCAAFKDRLGETFITYLNKTRVRKAAEFLNNPDISISEIAHLVGYKNIVHFGRVFKKFYGLSPTEYRKQKKTQNISRP